MGELMGLLREAAERLVQVEKDRPADLVEAVQEELDVILENLISGHVTLADL